MKSLSLSLLLSVWAVAASAKLNVVTTTQDWASVTQSIAGELADVNYIARGTQDAHFVEAKPSYMVKVSRADLVLSAGLQLEVGWLPLLVRGARRPNLLPGNPGYLEVSGAISPIEVNANADRSNGDVHPFGNPHFSADPERVLQVVDLIAKKLGELDAPHMAQYNAGAEKFKTELKKKIENWKARMAKFKGTKVIGYHKTFDYFFDRFGLDAVAYLEPKPGIPPTVTHVMSLIQAAKTQNVKLIINENFFDLKPARTLVEHVPGIKIVEVPANVGGDDKSSSYENWIEDLVSSVEKGMAP